MPKKQIKSTVTQEQLAQFFEETKNGIEQPMSIERKQKVDEAEERRRKMILDIGCTKVRIWSKEVKIIEWAVKNEYVVVEVGGAISRYAWPFKLYQPFVNLEILEDCGYLDRWATGDEYVVDGKRYGVKGDVVWAGGKRYLSSKERADFGSFEKFLAKQGEFTKKKAVI